jgi:hypothetical protein
MRSCCSCEAFRTAYWLAAAFVSALVFTGVGVAARPSPYPLDLSTAIGNAYSGKLTGIDRSCTVWRNGGRDEYALAAVTLRGGRSDVGGFQFINTAGWFNMWRYHAPTAGVPAGQRATVKRLVRQVATTCAARWSP